MGKSKYLGIGISVIGSILALLFVPTQMLGTNTGWHFIFECETAFRETLCAYQIINTTTLMLELIFINGVGFAIYYLGKKR